jgi:uncharacterized RDD family membrane protein YckC
VTSNAVRTMPGRMIYSHPRAAASVPRGGIHPGAGVSVAVAQRPAAPIASPPASIGGRLAAYALDWVVAFILTCVFLAAGGLVLLVTSDMGREDPPDRALVAALVIASLVVPVWFVMTLTGWTWYGRSVGKLAMNQRIVDGRGGPPGLGRSLLRLFVYVVENAPMAMLLPLAVAAWVTRERTLLLPALAGSAVVLPVPLVSAVLMMIDRRRRSLHDRVAGTLVVDD